MRLGMGGRGRRRVIDNFNWDASAELAVAAYVEILAPGPR